MCITDTREAATDVMQYTIHPYYDAVRSDFYLIQHNAVQCNGKTK